MSKSIRVRLLFASLAFFICVFAGLNVRAQTTEFTYQGSLKNSSLPASGNYDFEFTLFSALSGGSQGPTITLTNVVVSDGLFSVTLNFGASLFPGADRFLEIHVRQSGGGAFTPLTPRQPVTSAPYAIRSLDASQLGSINASGFIRNQATLQPTSNFNIDGNGFFGGNVGIGTTFPAARFHVTGASSDQNTPIAIVQSSGSQIPLAFRSGGTEVARVRADDQGNLVIATTNGTDRDMYFRAGGDTAGADMFIQSSTANVGIGTIAPVNRLSVYGAGNADIGVRDTLDNVEGVISANGDRLVVGTVTDHQVQLRTNNVIRVAIGGDGEIQFRSRAVPTNASMTINPTSSASVAIVHGSFDADGLVKIGLFTSGNAGTTVCRNTLGQLGDCGSSIRYKTDVHSFTPGLNLVNCLRPVNFRWKEGGQADFGLIAEDVAEVEPLLTFNNDKGEIEGVKYDRVGVVLINAVKEQQAQIEAQQKQIELQRKQIESLTKIVCETNSKADICRQ